MSWEKVLLGELAEFRNGINYDKRSFGKGLKVIGVADFQDYSKPRYEELEEVNPDGVVKIDDFLQDQDIIFVRSNGNKELIGRNLFIEAPPEPVTFSGFCIRARFKTNNVIPAFYAYVFRSDIIRKTLSAYGGGTNISNLNQKILARLEVPLPPKITQERVANILSSYDRLIDNNNRRIALIEESVHLLYKEWFVKLRFPGSEGTAIVDGIPEGWETNTIENAFAITGGGTPSTKIVDYWQDGVVAWYSPTDLTKAKTMFVEESENQITALGLSNSSARLFPAYSVMLTSRATIGVISINTVEACTNQGFITCFPNEKVPLYFLYCWLKSNVETFSNLATGATFKEISKGVFKKIPFVIPSSLIVQRFQKTVSPTAAMILNLQRQNRQLREARDLLLPRLMNGSIVV